MIANTIPASILAATLVALFVLRSRTLVTKVFFEAVLLILIAWCLISQGASPLPSGQILSQPNAGWIRALAAVWWLIAARLVAIVIVVALGRDARSKEATLVSDLLAAGIYVTAILIVLNSVLGLRVNGLLATSGIIAIVIGLALQNTLADVFSGIAVEIEQPFRIGDLITIGDHAEGKVVQMNWRSVRIETDEEDVATIPNSIVAKSSIVNRSFPTERRAASLQFPTNSTMRAEKLLELLRQAAMLCPDVLEDPAPTVSIKHLGARSTTFSISFHVGTSKDMSHAKGQLYRQVRRMFRYADAGEGRPMAAGPLLETLIPFESLSAEQIQSLAGALVRRPCHPGEKLFEQGADGSSLFVIQSGIFAVSKVEEDGRCTFVGRVGPGEYLGEISMMTGEKHPATVSAATAGMVLELPRAALENLIREDRAISAALELSIQRGLNMLDRDAAARVIQPLDAAGSLLGRIRSFLMLGPKPSRPI